MIRILTSFALAATALGTAPSVSAVAQEAPQLSLDHRMLLRCSAAFALVAHGQESGNEDALRYPPLAHRGREFFVRASAQVMEEAGLDRSTIETALSVEAQDIWDNGTLAQVMPVCLAMLPPE